MFNPLVVVLAYDGLCTFEFGIAVEVFGLPRPEMGENWYQFAVAGLDSGAMRATGGIHVVADGGLELLTQAGTIIIPGWKGSDVPVPAHLVDALRQAHQQGARLLSICSGVFILAATGLLSGRRATTHWRYSDTLKMQYPDINIEPDVLYIDEGTMLTSAGSAAGIDLGLHLIRRDYGSKAANQVARRLVVAPHRDGGQAQYIEKAVPVDYERSRLGAAYRSCPSQPHGRVFRYETGGNFLYESTYVPSPFFCRYGYDACALVTGRTAEYRTRFTGKHALIDRENRRNGRIRYRSLVTPSFSPAATAHALNLSVTFRAENR